MKSAVSAAADVLVRPVSARSAVIRILIAADSPTMTSSEICAATTAVGYPEATVRVAVSRMVASGELARDDRGYTLDPVLRARRTELAAPPDHPWDGDWEQVVITAAGRPSAERSALRTRLMSLRLAELREGVWLRPANLVREIPADLADITLHFRVRPVEEPADLAAALWPLAEWSARAEALLDAIESPDPAARFAAVSAALDLLTTDPALPGVLQPEGWPVAALRDKTSAYLTWLRRLGG
ncbi:PaaX domain-containing protein, C- domain protein [Nocardia caishijiensis]|uniref:Phenylacetic acid degradation operon negative regulatory protein n=1 Tax=Nocardia caishijiensis TaxID=184756 RepID=A0ABQ6YLM1_9NOCA|nr:PaaX domain-containing protein, C- domain protein [Nocardia caishijiensis]KAF0846682.1 phenylacetic acid degradation operon negative regulatory protein [Nocardia caishijiensis]